MKKISKSKIILLILLIIVVVSGIFLVKKLDLIQRYKNYLNQKHLEEILGNVKVIQPNENINPEDRNIIAVPQNVVEEKEKKGRSFLMTAQNDEFTPKIFTCYQGEELTITFKAVDKDYSIFQKELGLKTTVKKGNEAVINYLMSITGKFPIYCLSCENNLKPMGYIVVLEK